MSSEEDDTENRSDDRPRGSSSGIEDRFWLWLLALIVAVLFLIGLTSGDSGGGLPDGYTGWH
ncbi:hypothetical protein ACF064_06735 [Streptomyces sp. NPDC015492]|uniref:hypothetical protein n=1 Tax=unclassified Streptomyces TaxID=2593676 RepID=UPI0033F7DF00